MFASSLLTLTLGLALSLFSSTSYAQPSYPMQDEVLMVSSYDTNPSLESLAPNDPNVQYNCNVVVQIVDLKRNEQLDCVGSLQIMMR
jgi:hypothetical protein